jgi:hypothetical protein
MNYLVTDPFAAKSCYNLLRHFDLLDLLSLIHPSISSFPKGKQIQQTSLIPEAKQPNQTINYYRTTILVMRCGGDDSKKEQDSVNFTKTLAARPILILG